MGLAMSLGICACGQPARRPNALRCAPCEVAEKRRRGREGNRARRHAHESRCQVCGAYTGTHYALHCRQHQPERDPDRRHCAACGLVEGTFVLWAPMPSHQRSVPVGSDTVRLSPAEIPLDSAVCWEDAAPGLWCQTCRWEAEHGRVAVRWEAAQDGLRQIAAQIYLAGVAA
jgi:hypothetical protein